MDLAHMTKEEIELLSYTDMTYMILKESKKSMNTPTIFKKICELLDYSDEDFANKIGDYYTSLTIDKRFLLLDNNEWDLRENHSVKLFVDDEEDEEEIEESEDEEDEEEKEEYEEDVDEPIDDEDLDDSDEDLGDLSIVEDEEVDSN